MCYVTWIEKKQKMRASSTYEEIILARFLKEGTVQICNKEFPNSKNYIESSKRLTKLQLFNISIFSGSSYSTSIGKGEK